MPLYMDFHKFDHITIEEVQNAHLADQSVQDKYGVTYHQFWVNAEAGTVFCLTEGPDKETCQAVHQEAHGNIACALVEVEPGYFKMLMGEGHKVNHGLVQKEDGSLDLGYRFILVVSIRGLTKVAVSNDQHMKRTPDEARKLTTQKITEFKGRLLKLASDDNLIGVFSDAAVAVRCALQIQTNLINGTETGIIFKIGIGGGQPVTKNGEFFVEAVQLSNRLSNIAQEKQILVSSLVKNLCENDGLLSGKSIKALEELDEDFVSNLLTIIETRLADDGFTIEMLCQHVGLSRPQLYRKITSLTGRAPNDLVRDLRMDKAFTLLKRKSGNISEVALEVGYNNASYFAKCFSEKFGHPLSSWKLQKSKKPGLSNYCHSLNSN